MPGTDFNFLPIKENQATIGGLSDDSEYNKSITKILKDDNFVDEDYLTKRSAEQYNEDYDSGLLGQGPGNLDIGQTRVFTKPFDIYDFTNRTNFSNIFDKSSIEYLSIWYLTVNLLSNPLL